METYLGISEDINGSKCKFFAFLKDKLMNKVNRWKGRWFSKGENEVLIKSILLALLTYVMSTFLLPYMLKSRKCHCTILVEFKSPTERNSLGQTGKGLFTKEGVRDWFSYDP